MMSKNLFSVISLALFVFIGNTAFAECPSADLTGDCFVNYEDFAEMGGQWLDGYNSNDLAEMALQWLVEGIPEPSGMVWVDVNDPGVDDALEGEPDGIPDHEAFDGEMSKYETTNAQYCQFLNAAKTAGLITVYNDDVYAVSDTSHSEIYLELYPGSSSHSQIIYSGVVFGIRSRDGYSMSNHPVVEVSWYGATAFCNYYGYRLPTEWEWQAVADYDGSYTYGCGTTIDQSKANYFDNGFANPLNLSNFPYTSPVNHYSSYGYGMNDMSGNVWEWTSSCYYAGCSPDHRVICGGSWDDGCEGFWPVSYKNSLNPRSPHYNIGFRVCR